MKIFYIYDPTFPQIRECFFVGAMMFIDCFQGKEAVRLDRFGEYGPFDCMEDVRLFEDEEKAEEYLGKMHLRKD